MLCKCGYENREEAKFCAQCGLALPNITESSGGSSGKKSWLIGLAAAAAVIVCVILWLMPTAKKVEKRICAIGTVTVKSQGSLQDIYATYEKLSERERAKVASIDVLLNAMEECERQNQVIDKAIAAIDALDISSLNEELSVKDAQEKYAQALPCDLENRMDPYKVTLDEAATQIDKLWDEQDHYRSQAEDSVSQIIPMLFSGETLKILEAKAEYAEIIANLYLTADKEAYANQIMEAICAEAQTRFDAEKYYTAISGLTEHEIFDVYCSGQLLEKADTLEAAFLKQIDGIRPTNGAVIDRTYNAGRNTFKATAGDMDTCVKLELVDDPGQYVIFYIRANETATINFKNGEYRVKYTTGPVWYGDDALFGPEATFILLDETIDPHGYSTSNAVYWHEFTWTITSGYGDEYGYQNMRPEEF